ncbi:MAG: hypothetical protein GX677_05150 [Treponema sp.]|nr:hypothetical protein [Treponema sp.]
MNKYNNIPENKTVYEKENHSFLVTKSSLADQNIQEIIDIHYNAYQEIKKAFPIQDFKLFYNIFDNPLECAKAQKKKYPELFKKIELFPINAWTCFPDNIYFTYNNEIQAVGYHEVVHLVLYKYFGYKSIQFLNEGIAVYYDGSWKGKCLYDLAIEIIRNKKIEHIIYDETFDNINCNISYPLAGSFCKWLIQNYTIDEFKNIYKKTKNNEMNNLRNYFNEYVDFMKNS